LPIIALIRSRRYRIVMFGGAAVLAALVALAVSQAPLGSPLFFALAAVPCTVYAWLLREVLPEASHPAQPAHLGTDRLVVAALIWGALFRVPLAVPRVGADNDMVRYVYDGRLQRLGYNPFTILPADPAVASTHTDETRQMPSLRARTPYPAAAQLFFRLVVTLRESTRMMKSALIVCDLLTILVLVAWLRQTARSPWLALVYAWNPLVILEVAHSGHIDALGALWIALSAWLLSTGRGLRAALAFAVAAATKLLPIVLLPLFWRRIRLRDAAIATAAVVAMYVPFAGAGVVALGSVPNVVDAIRFNGPLFRLLAAASTPRAAAAAAVLAGLAVAALMRARTSADDPAAWAWPMAVALAAAPVVYPWYLLYFTPFLFTRRAVPLIAWTYSVLPVYVVWELAHVHHHRWFVPWPVLVGEYGVVILLGAISAMRAKAPLAPLAPTRS
jgi:hypothetical protein